MKHKILEQKEMDVKGKPKEESPARSSIDMNEVALVVSHDEVNMTHLCKMSVTGEARYAI